MTRHYVVLKPVYLYEGTVRLKTYSGKAKRERPPDTLLDTGDLLVHRPNHGNSLAIYRAGALVSVVTMSPLGIDDLLTARVLASPKLSDH